jgi:hypothetical protein
MTELTLLAFITDKKIPIYANKDGLCLITPLCEAFKARFSAYEVTKKGRECIAAVKAIRNGKPVVQKSRNGKHKGTFVDVLIAVDVAKTISPELGAQLNQAALTQLKVSSPVAKPPSRPAQLLLEDEATWKRRVADAEAARETAEAAKETAVVAYNHMSTTVTKLEKQKTKLAKRVAKAEEERAATAARAIRAVDKRKEETKWALFKQQRAEQFYSELERDVDDKYISLQELEDNYIPREKLFEQMQITKAEYDEMQRKYDKADLQGAWDRMLIQQLETNVRLNQKDLQRLRQVEEENRMLRKDLAAVHKSLATLRKASSRKRQAEVSEDAKAAVPKKSKVTSVVQ